MMRRAGIRWLSSTTKSIEEIATTILQEVGGAVGVLICAGGRVDYGFDGGSVRKFTRRIGLKAYPSAQALFI